MSELLDYVKPSGVKIKINANSVEHAESLGWKSADEKNQERLALEDRANALDIKFRSDISNEKLLEKILEVEKNTQED